MIRFHSWDVLSYQDVAKAAPEQVQITAATIPKTGGRVLEMAAPRWAKNHRITVEQSIRPRRWENRPGGALKNQLP